jgi:demethylmenaquinone methyltransferase / 2-methoxy-6-polyprenyl-1,4-benzoquinol methylase
MERPGPGPSAPDGSIHPDRRLPTFERDVQRMFGSIADRYDAFNHAATFGLDLLWRPRAVWAMQRYRRGPVRRALDVGCGTGGLSRLLASLLPGSQVVGIDFSRAMVRDASRSRRGKGGPTFAVGHAGHLPFADASFDLAASAFVARNFADLLGTLRELRRILRPGGTLLTLEVSEPASPEVRKLFHAHFDRVVPMLGRAFGRAGPYQYLPESLKSFPPAPEIVRLHGAAGFTRIVRSPMSGGIVTAYLAEAAGPAEEAVKRAEGTSRA